MAQVEKYTLQQAKAIIAHVERTGATHSNDRIDPDRAERNYALWPRDNPDKLILDDPEHPGRSSGRYAFQRLKKRLSEVSMMDRDDVNVLCSWCMHLGKDVPPGYDTERDFFEACVRVMVERYGEENVVYAWVHDDEEGKHLHFGFVPVVWKEVKLRKNASAAKKAEYEAAVAAGQTEVERVDAHSIINWTHLKGWHGWMTQRLTQILGYDPAVHTGITKHLGENISVPDLKFKGKNWRRNRNAAVAKFHEARRAAATGTNASLDAKIYMADPNAERPQAEPAVEPTRKRGLDSIIGGAKERSGK